MSKSLDPWIHTLQALQPAYFKWRDILETKPKIRATLSQRDRSWCIKLEEENLAWTATGVLDERIQWTMDQLIKWPRVRRMSYDMWYFNRKIDAEKFQTLYNLKWASE